MSSSHPISSFERLCLEIEHVLPNLKKHIPAFMDTKHSEVNGDEWLMRTATTTTTKIHNKNPPIPILPPPALKSTRLDDDEDEDATP